MRLYSFPPDKEDDINIVKIMKGLFKVKNSRYYNSGIKLFIPSGSSACYFFKQFRVMALV